MLEAELKPGEWAAIQQGEPEPFARILGEIEPDAVEAQGTALDVFVPTCTAPLVALELRLRRGAREQHVVGGLGPGLVVAMDPAASDAGPQYLVLGAADEFPRLIAELVDLGPRPFDSEKAAIPMPYEPLDAFAGFGCDEEILAATHDAFDDRYGASDIDALFDGQALRWTLTLTGPQGGVELDVIDARERGLWIIADGPQPDAVLVQPATSSAVWILLSGALSAFEPDPVSAGA